MKHFIDINTKRISGIYYIVYNRNNETNKIGDFSEFYYNNSYEKVRKYNSYEKARKYRGKYFYSKKPHYERSDGIKGWCYNNRWYNSYEEYILAVIG